MIVHYTVLTLWFLAIATLLVCLGSLFWKRLAGAYFLLTVWLAFSAADSIWGMHVYFAHGMKAYLAAWAASQAATLALGAGVALEAYILQARHCRRFLWPGALVAAVFALTSIAVVASTAGFVSEGIAGWFPMQLLTRHFDLACLVFLQFSVWFFRLFRVEIRENVRWHVRILSLIFLCDAVGVAMYTLPQTRWSGAVANFAVLGGSIACSILWSVKLTRKGEVWVPQPEKTPEEIAAIVRKHERANRRILLDAEDWQEALLAARRLSH